MDHSPACSLAGNVGLLLAAIPIGVLIGLLGVGGILLVPFLSLFAGCSEHQTIGLSLASFVALGATSAFVHVRSGWRPNRGEIMLFSAMIPGALLGTLIAGALPDIVLRAGVALAVAVTGGWTLVFQARASAGVGLPGPARLAAIGAGSGLTCALTGAGGPVVVMPLLLVQGAAVREALTISQVAQLPIAATVTLLRSITGGLMLGSAGLLSVSLMIGLFAGMRMNGLVRTHILQKIVGWSLVSTGIAMAVVVAIPFKR